MIKPNSSLECSSQGQAHFLNMSYIFFDASSFNKLNIFVQTLIKDWMSLRAWIGNSNLGHVYLLDLQNILHSKFIINYQKDDKYDTIIFTFANRYGCLILNSNYHSSIPDSYK